LVAQQLALVVALRLAAHGREGSVVVFQVATALFLLPWAVLAVPVATTAFPRLTASAEKGEEKVYADIAARSLAAVLVAMLGGVAVLIAVAGPAARLLAAGVPGPERVGALSDGVVAFAPGLVGYGLLALVGRALYARGDGRTVALATVAGWLVVAGLDVGLVAATDLDRVTALGLGNTGGMTVAGVLLLLGLRRAAPEALRGCGMTAAAGAVAAGLAVGAAALVPGPGTSVWGSLLSGLALAGVAGVVFVGVLRLLRPGALRVLRDV
jgi:peptidoglycan biosynthesis protein MviN/MurJ (putative lipid II flippase)